MGTHDRLAHHYDWFGLFVGYEFATAHQWDHDIFRSGYGPLVYFRRHSHWQYHGLVVVHLQNTFLRS